MSAIRVCPVRDIVCSVPDACNRHRLGCVLETVTAMPASPAPASAEPRGPGWDHPRTCSCEKCIPDAPAAPPEPPPSAEPSALELLRELHTMVWGECPSLLNEDSGGDAALDMSIRELLAAPAPTVGPSDAEPDPVLIAKLTKEGRNHWWAREAAARLTALSQEKETAERERDRALELAERLKMEAQCHAMEARTANATIAEIYQVCTGSTGEPGNWHGAEPVRRLATAAANAAVEASRKDAERYRAWRQAHAAGMRPFLPRQMPVTSAGAIWTHPFAYDPPNDEWMRASPEQRCDMIDAAVDAAQQTADKGAG